MCCSPLQEISRIMAKTLADFKAGKGSQDESSTVITVTLHYIHKGKRFSKAFIYAYVAKERLSKPG